jgi:hypothetical protein
MLEYNILEKFNITARHTERNLYIARAREYVSNLIDEFWRFYKNPDDYVSKISGNDETLDCYVPGVWSEGDLLVQKSNGETLVRIPFAGNYIPLTHSGRTELLIFNPTLEVIEEVLAEIKAAINSGKADKFFISQQE